MPKKGDKKSHLEKYMDQYKPGVDNLDCLAGLIRVRAGCTLVIGSKVYNGKPDRRMMYKSAIGIDLFDGEGVDEVHDITSGPYTMTGVPFDHVDCVSMLEHCKNPWKAARNISKSLADDGTILVSVPFTWRIHAYPDDYYRFTPAGLKALFDDFEWIKMEIMCYGVPVERVPVITTTKGDFYLKSEIVGWGKKK
jgi:SAM-dependent methyltransferase